MWEDKIGEEAVAKTTNPKIVSYFLQSALEHL